MNKTTKLIIAALATTLVAMVAVGCTNYTPQTDSQSVSQRVTQEYNKKLTAKVPYPLEQMNDSIELRNLREKLLRFNKPDKIGYVYTFSNTGEVIDFYTIKGKVSSTQSQMTVTDQAQYICQVKPFLPKDADVNRADNQVCDWAITKSPGDDGSYGDNEPGIFFFTTEDVYVSMSFNTIWRYYDAPLKVDSVTHKVIELPAESKPSSVGEPVEKRQG